MKKYLPSILYVIITAASVLLIHFANANIAPLWLLLFSTTLATIYFHSVNIHALKNMYRLAWIDKSRWLLVMILVALIWLTTFYGSSISPSIFMVLYFSVAAFLGLVTTIRQQQEKKYSLLIVGLGMLLTVSFIIVIMLNQTFKLAPKTTLLLLMYGVIGGVTSFLYMRQSYLFSKKTTLKPTQILAVRFWLLIGICILLAPMHEVRPSLLNIWNIIIIVMVSIISLILPLYFNQKGIIEAGPEINAIIGGYTPALTYLLAVICMLQPFHLDLFLLYCLVAFFIGWPFLKKMHSTHR